MVVTIDGLNREEKETQYGMKARIGLKIVEQKVFDINGSEVTVADRWLNGMMSLTNNGTENWQKGMKVNIAISEKEGKYLNFKVVRDDSAPASPSPVANTIELEEIKARLTKLEVAILGGAEKKEVDTEPVVDPTDDF